MTIGAWWQSVSSRRASAWRGQSRAVATSQCCLWSEGLEDRRLLSGEYRTLDGTGNNLLNPEWGSTDEQFVRGAPADYADGVAVPAGSGRPSPRAISNGVVAQGNLDLPNDRYLSAFVYAWGQFLDHDIVLSAPADPREEWSIPVPAGDPSFDPTGSGTVTLPFARSQYDPGSGTSTDAPRQQVNSNTSFIDGSQIYGSTAARAAALRTFQGGRLKTSDGNLLPRNTLGLPNQIPPGSEPPDFFVAGDIRANENVQLTALHTLFVREHNRWANRIAATRPGWSDEQIFQEARRIVIGEIQQITYNEFLPALLGHPLPNYQGYQPEVNPGILNEFAAAAFRFGHSMLGTDVEFLDNQGNPQREALELRDAFFNPAVVRQWGIDGILKYLASDLAQEIDVHVIDDLRNFLFGPPGAGGMDLASLNLQRGRDHGLASYNALRQAYGLAPAGSFAEISGDPAVQQRLASVYGSVDEVDLWVGGLAETRLPGSSFGPLFHRIIQQQFEVLRAGDRFWYERSIDPQHWQNAQRPTLASIIRRNSTVQNVQDNVFEFRVEIRGVVGHDVDRDGSWNPQEPRLAGVVVQLLDAQGFEWGSASTDADGVFRFVGVDLGSYSLRVLSPAGMEVTTPPLPVVEVTRGGLLDGMNFGLASAAERGFAATDLEEFGKKSWRARWSAIGASGVGK